MVTTVVAERTTTTRATLRLLRTLLLTGTALVLLTSWLTFHLVSGTISVASGRTALAIMAVSSAQRALTQADAAAVRAFGADDVRLVGPGNDYQNGITLAVQSLEQVAEGDTATGVGAQTLQLVDGQLAAYSGMIEQADADYSANQTQLGVAELLYASKLMHMPQTGIIDELNSLGQQESSALNRQLAAAWMSPAAVLIWAVPALALLASLIGTQRYLSRRFRRTFNAWLLGATAVLVLLIAAGAVTLVAEHRMGGAKAAVDRVVADRQAGLGPITVGAGPFRDTLNAQCTSGPTGYGCGTVMSAVSVATMTADAKAATDATTLAQNGYGLQLAIPLAGLLIGVLVLCGLYVPLREYRYGAR